MKSLDFKKLLLEGGNVTINDQSADRIDSNAREQAVPLIDNALAAINAAFAQFSGQPLWHPKLLASRQFLSGSAFHFFDRTNISDLKFVAAKPTVGDIDTQVDAEMRDSITAWLQKLPPGSRLGEAVYIGLKDDPLSLGGPQLITLWNFPGIQVRTKNPDGSTTVRGCNVQIDLELKEFEVSPGTDYRQPTRWSKFSASSSWDDLSAGVKGVFHKYLIMALGKITEQTVIIRKPVYNRKTKEYDSYKYSEPTQAQMFTFAVGSREGGGLRPTLRPVIGSDGKHEEIDGVPVYDVAGATGYSRDVDQIFMSLFGKRMTKSQLKQFSPDFDSFTGLLSVMKKLLKKDERQRVADKFREKIIGTDEQNRRAQELYKGDPKKDRAEKMAAYTLLLKQLGAQAPGNFEQMSNEYYRAYDKGAGEKNESLNEQEPVDYSRKGIPHLYNRLPDGRVSSAEMRDAEFIELCKEIAENNGQLDDVDISLKVDGAGIRFGRDSSGRAFFMTSRVTEPMYVDDIGAFTRFGQQQGQSDEQLARTKNYDDALSLIVKSDFIRQLPKDTIVQAEMLYNPMATPTPDGLKFVNIAYDKKALGRQMTLVPISVRQYSTGGPARGASRIINKLVAASTPDIKIVTNKLTHQGINVAKIVDPVVKLDPKRRKENREALDRARQALSQAIMSSPAIKGRDALGKNTEGVVIRMPSGRMAKITSTEMKSAMSAKLAPKQQQATTSEFGDTQPRTAVVAVGNFAGHRGHEALINFAIEQAKKQGGTPFVFVGSKVGADDPIDVKTKLETLKKLFPGVSISAVENQVSATGSTTGNILKKIEYELVKKPPFYNRIVIAVGSDRTDDMTNWTQSLQRRFSKFPPLAHVQISVASLPRGSEQGGSDWSTTALRNSLKTKSDAEAFQDWARAYNVEKLGADYIRHLMAVARGNMGLRIQADEYAEQAAANFRRQMGEARQEEFRSRWQHYLDETSVSKQKQQFRSLAEVIVPGDHIRTRGMTHRGIVESVELYRPFGEQAVYFKTADGNLLRTPLSNVVKIPQGEQHGKLH